MRKKGPVLLILDGFDEVATHSTEEDVSGFECQICVGSCNVARKIKKIVWHFMSYRIGTKKVRATSAAKIGRYPKKLGNDWWACQDSNLGPDRYERQESSQKTAENLTFSFNRVEFRS